MPTNAPNACTPVRDRGLAVADERRAGHAAGTKAAPIIEPPCALPAVVASAARRRKAGAGFTLIELLAGLAVTGVLSSIAYPSFTSQVQKARRADVLVAMMQVQMAEERWRNNAGTYGSLGQIGVASSSTAGFYTLGVTVQGDTGYEVLATASGVQAGDSACRNLRLTVDGANVEQASGPDAHVANSADANRKCWNL